MAKEAEKSSSSSDLVVAVGAVAAVIGVGVIVAVVFCVLWRRQRANGRNITDTANVQQQQEPETSQRSHDNLERYTPTALALPETNTSQAYEVPYTDVHLDSTSRTNPPSTGRPGPMNDSSGIYMDMSGPGRQIGNAYGNTGVRNMARQPHSVSNTGVCQAIPQSYPSVTDGYEAARQSGTAGNTGVSQTSNNSQPISTIGGVQAISQSHTYGNVSVHQATSPSQTVSKTVVAQSHPDGYITFCQATQQDHPVLDGSEYVTFETTTESTQL